MSNSITDFLAAILSAKYGEQVRGAIHDAIELCYQDGKAGVNDLEARQLIEAVAEVNEQQAAALEVLQARVEELESGEGGSSQQSTTIDIPTVLVDGGVVENVSVNNNSTKTQHVTFTTEFTETPKVMVAIGKNVGAVSQYGYLSANILYPTITTTGFDFFLANRTGSDRSPGVVWYAYQPTVKTIDLDITIPETEGMTEAQVRAITGPIAAAVDALKTGYDGTTYQTAAEAVRTQINDLHVLIGDEPGTAISADSIGYEDGSVADALAGLNGRLDEKVSKHGAGEITPQNTTFFEMSENLFDFKTAFSGKRLSGDGKSLIDSSAFVTSDFINVSKHDGVRFYRDNGNTVSTPIVEYVLYDSAFSPLGNRTGTNAEIDTSAATYIRIDGTDSIKHQYMLVDSSATVTSYIPYGATFLYDSGRLIHVSPSDDIIQILKDNSGKTIVFDAGSYDIIGIYKAKYGDSYFDNYAGYSTNDAADRGLPVGRGTKLFFNNGAVFTCNYTGSNTSVRNNFSAFAIESGVEINGLRLKSSGIRNCIHDDFDNFFNGTLPTVIKNCNLEHDRMVIAGGLAQHDIVIIEDCIFTDTFSNHTTDFYYHNNANVDAQSYMVIKGCYMNKGVGIKYFGASTKITDVIVTNNSMARDVDFGANGDGTNVNISLRSWNNVIR